MKAFENIDTSPRYDFIGKLTYLCQTGGYVIAKHARRRPTVLTLKEWAALPKEQSGAASDEY